MKAPRDLGRHGYATPGQGHDHRGMRRQMDQRSCQHRTGLLSVVEEAHPLWPVGSVLR